MSHQPFYALLSLAFTLQLFSACTPAVTSPNGTPQPQVSAPAPAEDTLFDSALSREEVDTAAAVNSGGASAPVNPSGTPASAPSAYPMPEPSAAPSAYPYPAPGINDISAGYPGGYYPGYGSFSGDFNHYVAIRAERITYPGSNADDLQGVYQARVQTILNEWDPSARLIESRGQSNPDPDQPEYIYLPDASGNEPLQFNARWVFQFSSTARKETLNIYINGEETRAYRVIYGQPAIELNKAEVSSTQAIATAKAAFANRSAVNYPVYPAANEPVQPERKVIYELPENLNWRVNLTQQGNSLVYALSFNYTTTREALNLPATSPTASPSVEPSLSPEDPAPEASPFPMVTPTPLPGDCYTYGIPEETVYLNGSISIDAVSGEVLNLNRPVYYDYYSMQGPCVPYATPYPGAYPSVYPSVYPSAYPSAASDL